MTKKALFLFSIVIFFLVVSVSYILQKQDFIFTPANKFSATSEPVPSELESGKKPPEEKLILMPDEVAELAKNQTSEQTPLAESAYSGLSGHQHRFNPDACFPRFSLILFLSYLSGLCQLSH